MLDCCSLCLAEVVQQACVRDCFLPGTAKGKLPIIESELILPSFCTILELCILFLKNLFILISQIPTF